MGRTVIRVYMNEYSGSPDLNFILAYMLSFRNAKTVDLYVNRRVSENRAFMRKLVF